MTAIRKIGILGLGKMGAPMALVERARHPRRRPDHEVERAIFGPGGIAEAPSPYPILALGSTVAPSYARRLAERLKTRGIVLLDIPLARGEAAAVAGKLLIFGAGDEASFEACRPAFRAFASDIFHLGPRAPGRSARW